MPTRPLRIWRAQRLLLVTPLVATMAYGVEQEQPSIPLHPLVTAAELLYQQGLPQACAELMRQASMAPGLTDDDLMHLQLLTALRALDEGDEVGARSAVSRALRANP